MSLADHTRIHLEHRGKLTQIGAIVVESLNEMAALHAAGKDVPNHVPASPGFWFAGLAREHAGGYGDQFSHASPFESETIRGLLTDAAILLAREVLACSCDGRWGSWDPGNPWAGTRGGAFACYPCAFDAHGMCIHGCEANQSVLDALAAEIEARSLTAAYERPLFDALGVYGDLRDAVRHVLRYGKLGKQSRNRLEQALDLGHSSGPAPIQPRRRA